MAKKKQIVVEEPKPPTREQLIANLLGADRMAAMAMECQWSIQRVKDRIDAEQRDAADEARYLAWGSVGPSGGAIRDSIAQVRQKAQGDLDTLVDLGRQSVRTYTAARDLGVDMGPVDVIDAEGRSAAAVLPVGAWGVLDIAMALGVALGAHIDVRREG